jgi:hypothetical protein
MPVSSTAKNVAVSGARIVPPDYSNSRDTEVRTTDMGSTNVRYAT